MNDLAPRSGRGCEPDIVTARDPSADRRDGFTALLVERDDLAAFAGHELALVAGARMTTAARMA